MPEYAALDKDTIKNRIMPYLSLAKRGLHPGEMIKKELKTRGITQKQLADETAIPSSILNAILNEKSAVTTEYALLLEAALGIDADLWLRLQSDYNKQMLKSNPIFMERLKTLEKL